MDQLVLRDLVDQQDQQSHVRLFHLWTQAVQSLLVIQIHHDYRADLLIQKVLIHQLVQLGQLHLSHHEFLNHQLFLVLLVDLVGLIVQPLHGDQRVLGVQVVQQQKVILHLPGVLEVLLAQVLLSVHLLLLYLVLRVFLGFQVHQ